MKPFYAEQTVVVDGEPLTLAIDFAAIDATERLSEGRPYNEILDELQKPDCPIGTTGRVVWGLLRKHHREMTIDQAASLLFGENSVIVGAAVSELLNAAFPTVEKAKAKGPRKPRGTLESSSGDGARSRG